MPRIEEMFRDEEWHFQQGGAPPHYHRDDLRTYLDGRGQEDGVIEYPPRSSDLTPLDFFCGGMSSIMFMAQYQLKSMF